MDKSIQTAGGKPEWLKVRYNAKESTAVASLMASLGLNTVCDSANCPNIGECFRKKTATFMILGKNCTRNCKFCNIGHTSKKDLLPPDPEEPRKIAKAAAELGLRHAVITCVTRDDLEDGGAAQFAAVIHTIHESCPGVTAEVLISDMMGRTSSYDIIMDARPDVLNHNMETVRELYADIRPKASYERSLRLLRYCKEKGAAVTKTGIMLGLGETDAQISVLFSDIASVGCDILTISQYLPPSSENAPLVRYVTPAEFEDYKKEALSHGIKYVVSSPLVRSSYLAAEAFNMICGDEK